MRMYFVPWSTSLKQLVKGGLIQLTNCGRRFFCGRRWLSPADHELQGRNSTWVCRTDFSWALEKHEYCSQLWCTWGFWHGPGRWRTKLQVSSMLGKMMIVTLNEFWSLLDQVCWFSVKRRLTYLVWSETWMPAAGWKSCAAAVQLVPLPAALLVLEHSSHYYPIICQQQILEWVLVGLN